MNIQFYVQDQNTIAKGSFCKLVRANFHSMYSVSKTPVHPSAWSLLGKRRPTIGVLVAEVEGEVVGMWVLVGEVAVGM